jgi:hypothetical protein
MASKHKRQLTISCPAGFSTHITDEKLAANGIVKVAEGRESGFELETRGEPSEAILYQRGNKTKLAKAYLDDSTSIERLLSMPRAVARAQELLEMETQHNDDFLQSRLDIEIGKVCNQEKQETPFTATAKRRRRSEPLMMRPTNGKPLSFIAGDEYYIKLKSEWDSEILEDKFHVSIFRVDTIGRIRLISVGQPDGIEIKTNGQTHPIQGENNHGMVLPWPRFVPNQEEAPGHFLFVVTQKKEDLRSLETRFLEDEDDLRRKANSAEVAARNTDNHYFLACIPYNLAWSDERAFAGDAISSAVADGNLLIQTQDEGGVAKGSKGPGIWKRWRKDIDSFWVFNGHDEEIWVHSTPFATAKDMTSINLQGSSSGGGGGVTLQVSFPSIFASINAYC